MGNVFQPAGKQDHHPAETWTDRWASLPRFWGRKLTRSPGAVSYTAASPHQEARSYGGTGQDGTGGTQGSPSRSAERCGHLGWGPWRVQAVRGAAPGHSLAVKPATVYASRQRTSPLQEHGVSPTEGNAAFLLVDAEMKQGRTHSWGLGGAGTKGHQLPCKRPLLTETEGLAQTCHAPWRSPHCPLPMVSASQNRGATVSRGSQVCHGAPRPASPENTRAAPSTLGDSQPELRVESARPTGLRPNPGHTEVSSCSQGAMAASYGGNAWYPDKSWFWGECSRQVPKRKQSHWPPFWGWVPLQWGGAHLNQRHMWPCSPGSFKKARPASLRAPELRVLRKQRPSSCWGHREGQGAMGRAAEGREPGGPSEGCHKAKAKWTPLTTETERTV